MSKKKSVWRIIPSRDPEDQLYNRRLISYFSLLYSAVWFQEVLFLIMWSIYLKTPVEAEIVVALLGVPASLAGLGFWNYLKACKDQDKKKEADPAP